MVSSDTRINVCEYPSRSLYTSLYFATQVIDDITNGLYTDYRCQRHSNKHQEGHELTNAALEKCFRNSAPTRDTGTIFEMIRSWLRDHEDAQVMVASILVVFGVWWLVRTIISLLFNLVCPLLVVILALVCVPQLRAPLLGQNYPALANLLRNILLKMAETLKTST